MQLSNRRIQCRIPICGRHNADHGSLHAGRTECCQLLRECRCLCTRARHKDVFPEKRANIRTIKPAQLLPQLYHLTNNEDRRRSNAVALHHCGGIAERRDIRFLIGTRSPTNDCSRRIGGAPVVHQILRNLREIGDAHQKDQRIDTGREMLPSNMRLGLRRILMPRDDRKGNGHTAMGDGDARIGRNADCGSHARQHLERNAARKKHKRFLPAAPKDKGIAPFESDDRLAFIRLVRKQDIDILLPHRMLVGLLADIDPFCLRRHISENTLIRQMIIDNNIRLLQAVHRTDCQKARIPRTRADKKYFSTHTAIPISFKISRPPTSNSSSARAIPIFSASAGVPIERDRQTRIPSIEAIIASTWSTLPSPTSA